MANAGLVREDLPFFFQTKGHVVFIFGWML